MNGHNGLLFEPAFVASLKEKFYCVDADPNGEERLFFDNSGGSLRLRAAVEAKAASEAYPDCPEIGRASCRERVWLRV